MINLAPYRLVIEIALGASLLIGGALWWHEHNVKEQEIGQAKVLAQVQKQQAEDKAQGEKAVADARARAAQREAHDAADRAAQYQAEKEIIEKQMADAHAKAALLEKKYQQALRTPECDAWQRAVVACPLE